MPDSNDVFRQFTPVDGIPSHSLSYPVSASIATPSEFVLTSSNAPRVSGVLIDAPILSVVIPTIAERLDKYYRLMQELLRQCVGKSVETLSIFDNRVQLLSTKLNLLYETAKGKFISLIDDDDDILPSYVDSILKTISENPDADLIVFDELHTYNNNHKMIYKFDVSFTYTDRGGEVFECPPSPCMVWNRELALTEKFTHQPWGRPDRRHETMVWTEAMVPKVKKQVRINEALYHYNYNDAVSVRGRNV